MKVKQGFPVRASVLRNERAPGTITSATPHFGDIAMEPSEPFGKGNILNTLETAVMQDFFRLSHSGFSRHFEMGVGTKAAFQVNPT